MLDLQMKEAFEVAEEGFDLRDDEENEDLMRQFVDYIKNAKVSSVLFYILKGRICCCSCYLLYFYYLLTCLFLVI